MKNEKHKKRLGLFVLFLEFFGILFVGFCLCNVIAVTIDCVFEASILFWKKLWICRSYCILAFLLLYQ
jgi:hypothetical protein